MKTLGETLSRTGRTSWLAVTLAWGAAFVLLLGSTYAGGIFAKAMVAAGVILLLVGIPLWIGFMSKQLRAFLAFGVTEARKKRPPEGPN